VQGGSATPLGDGWTRLTFSDISPTGQPQYTHRTIIIELQTP
jgi:hypothetical protein